jgi:hypothetical protein
MLKRGCIKTRGQDMPGGKAKQADTKDAEYSEQKLCG